MMAGLSLCNVRRRGSHSRSASPSSDEEDDETVNVYPMMDSLEESSPKRTLFGSQQSPFVEPRKRSKSTPNGSPRGGMAEDDDSSCGGRSVATRNYSFSEGSSFTCYSSASTRRSSTSSEFSMGSSSKRSSIVSVCAPSMPIDQSSSSSYVASSADAALEAKFCPLNDECDHHCDSEVAVIHSSCSDSTSMFPTHSESMFDRCTSSTRFQSVSFDDHIDKLSSPRMETMSLLDISPLADELFLGRDVQHVVALRPVPPKLPLRDITAATPTRFLEKLSISDG